MRPLHLTMSAFGPFAEEEIINFQELGNNPLFLINGPTGAGKSTILDAICYALYGETTGNEREGKQMRCDRADASLLTEVVLEFQLGSACYRVSRMPDQARPKSRGEGLTEQKAQAYFYRLEDDSEHLIAGPKLTEVTNEVINLTGLSAEQFRQVMVLPQGKFRDLLLAKSEDREKIFEQLFQTYVYSKLQAALRDQANVLVNELKEVQQQKKALLLASELQDEEQLHAELKTIEALLHDLESKKQQADVDLKKSQKVLYQAQRLDQAYKEYEHAQQTVNELKIKQPKIDQDNVKLNTAKNARLIEPIFLDAEKQKLALHNAIQQSEDAKKAFDESEEALSSLEKEKQLKPELENKVQALSAKQVELEHYRKRSQQVSVMKLSAEQADKALQLHQKQVEKKQQKLLTLKKTLEELDETFQVRSKVVAELPEKKVQLEKLEEQGKSVRKITDLQSEIAAAEKQLEQLEKSEAKAEATYHQALRKQEIYEQAWQKGQAALLAANLVIGEPCPVCGSTEHPSLTHTDETLPTEQELDQVRKFTNQCRAELEKISRQRLVEQQELKNHQASVNEESAKDAGFTDLSLQSIREQYAKCKLEIDELVKTANGLPALQTQINQHKTSLISLEAELEGCRKTVMEASSAHAAAKTELDSTLSELPESYRQIDVLDSAVSQTSQELNLLKKRLDDFAQRYQQAREKKVSAETTLNAAKTREQNINTQYQQLQEKWQNNLAESVFDNEQAYLAARMDEALEQSTLSSVRQFEDEKLLAQKQLQEKSNVVADTTRPDTATLETALTQVEREKNNFDSEYHKVAQRKQTLSKMFAQLRKNVSQQNKLESDYGVVGKLADISNGKNPHNLSLQRFVLATLLDDVLIEASYRLHKMSKGRYQLYRKESVGDKRSKAGLDLEVEDAYTGKQRPVATLSGGESFLAALSLALGLSDVVQSYAGGIRLDTLFVDEGFGSLDPESLDLAISTLIELQASGRMIGIISHVSELKACISTRLDLSISQSGSHITMVLP